MRLTTEELHDCLPVRSLNKTQFKHEDFNYTGFENKKLQTTVKDSVLYFSIKGMKTPNDWRELGTKVGTAIKATKTENAHLTLSKVEPEFLEGLLLSDYTFNKYKSEPKEAKEIQVQLVILNGDDVVAKLEEITSRVKAQFVTKDWVNTTPEDAHSGTISQYIKDRFKDTSIKVEYYMESDMERLNMNGHLAVNRASLRLPITVKLSHTPDPGDEKVKHHVFVGKGLTYDSGGLSIKPGNSMVNMKSDKAGAMTLLGFMEYVEKHGSEHKITCYLALAENMIDDNAYKPDDVLTMKNGKTVHVKNTDAEGRLVLFDNLALAEEENDDITSIHSLATLTGAAVYQFDGAAGLVGFNDKLKKKVQRAGDKADEIYMDAAFHKNMMDGVDDKLADLSNTGTPNMGCQKAGLFLTNALTKKAKKKYVHHDIAGPAFVKGFSTGFGVRTLIEFIKA